MLVILFRGRFFIVYRGQANTPCFVRCLLGRVWCTPHKQHSLFPLSASLPRNCYSFDFFFFFYFPIFPIFLHSSHYYSHHSPSPPSVQCRPGRGGIVRKKLRQVCNAAQICMLLPRRPDVRPLSLLPKVGKRGKWATPS